MKQVLFWFYFAPQAALGMLALLVCCQTFPGAARGDECSAYLTHILGSYDHLADFTIFLQSDPMDHLHFDFLDLVLRLIGNIETVAMKFGYLMHE